MRFLWPHKVLNKTGPFFQGLNIIYVDAPVGTGFSYSNTSEGYYSGDMESAMLTYEFLRKVHQTCLIILYFGVKKIG